MAADFIGITAQQQIIHSRSSQANHHLHQYSKVWLFTIN